MKDSDPSAGAPGGLPSTHWTVIIAARYPDSPAGQQALDRFCKSYWYPIYAFIRKHGHPHHAAQDLTQNFFARLLEKKILARVTPGRGRFRSYLLRVLRRFLVNARCHEHALKRGGGKTFVSIDDSAGARYEDQPRDADTPESVFHRQWALAVMEQAVCRLREYYRKVNKELHFRLLACCLPGAMEPVSYPEAAKALSTTEAAVRMEASRLLRRYGKALRAELASLGCTAEEIKDEIRFLMQVVG
jgi:RNA polymerase sigma factor (sigma-70 family)